MVDVERETEGWRAYALELWAESRERVADELREQADCLDRIGLVEEAERNRDVSLHLWARARSDRAEAAKLWQCSGSNPSISITEASAIQAVDVV